MSNTQSIMEIRYSPLGESKMGGFGEVSFFIDRNLERKVAIKTIQNFDELPRLKDEISALMKMRSKHVVQVFDIVQYPESFGIVMEYINGQDLMDPTPYQESPDKLLKLLWQISSGISDIHNVGVIHRDIKPNNMKVDEEGTLKIFDFGLARNIGIDARTVGFVGTHGFSAPEQYKYGELEFTNAIDVYSFAATALYLAKNIIPSPYESVEPNVFDGSKLDEYPLLKEILISCLEFDPIKRPNIDFVCTEIGKHLKHLKHQALAVFNGKTHILNKDCRRVTINLSSIGGFDLNYDGYRFTVENVSGEVYINNTLAISGTEIPGACVVAIGSKDRHYTQRSYITFDISNPEVTL